MKQSRMRIITLLFCLATLICMLQNQIDGRADSAESNWVFKLYPEEENSLSWFTPSFDIQEQENSIQQQSYECFLPFLETEEEVPNVHMPLLI